MYFESDGLDLHKFIHPKKRTVKHSKYSCTAVVHHRGETMKAGHYVAYIREQLLDRKDTDTRWCLYDDRFVSAVPREDDIMVSPCSRQVLDEQLH